MLLWGKEETTSLRSLEYMLPFLRGETTHLNKQSKENTHLNKRSKKTPTSTSEAMLSPPLEDRPLVEEREEFFALSREEEKAV